MTPFQFLIFSLATWRMASLLVNEEGPFRLFVRIRELTGIVHHPADGSIVQIPDNLFAGIVSCVWCSSVYIGTFWAVLTYFYPPLAFWLAFPFALSAGAVFLNLIANKLK